VLSLFLVQTLKCRLAYYKHAMGGTNCECARVWKGTSTLSLLQSPPVTRYRYHRYHRLMWRLFVSRLAYLINNLRPFASAYQSSISAARCLATTHNKHHVTYLWPTAIRSVDATADDGRGREMAVSAADFTCRSVKLQQICEYFCHICVKCFILFTTVQKLYKLIKIFQSYDHKCSANPFNGLQCMCLSVDTPIRSHFSSNFNEI